MFWITIFTAKPFHTPFPPLPIQPFSDTMPSAWWDIHITCNYGTPLQSMGNCTHNPCCILLLTSFTYVHDWACSSVHASTFYPLPTHHHLCGANDCYVHDWHLCFYVSENASEVSSEV